MQEMFIKKNFKKCIPYSTESLSIYAENLGIYGPDQSQKNVESNPVEILIL